MIPDVSVSFYRFMQFTIAVIGIQFELVGFHGIVPATELMRQSKPVGLETISGLGSPSHRLETAPTGSDTSVS